MTDKELVDSHVQHIMCMFQIDDAQARAAIEFVFRERRNYRQLIAEAFGFKSEGVSVLAQCRALAAEMPRWVPVSEKLPEFATRVLIVCKRGEMLWVNQAERQPYHSSSPTDFYWYRGNDGSLNPEDVTHWQPLPSPPREEAK